MAWKAGVAAELIGLPLGSVGERIYQSKILLSSADLFAWTLVVAVAALVCEKLFLRMLRASENAAWHLALPRRKPPIYSVIASASEAIQLRINRPQAGLLRRYASRNDGREINRWFRSQKARHGAVGTEGGAGNGTRGLGDGAGNSAGCVLISGLNKTFGKGREAHTVITCFSAILQPKGRYVLNSPSGAGKTTLLRVIAGLCLPDSGTIRGVGRLAMVFQEARLFEGRSAVDNLRLVVGRAYSDSGIRRLLSTVLSPEVLDQPVAELSGGMRRRVELCRALAADSQLLLLDEPFTGLDEVSHAAARSLVLSELRGRVLLLATHDSKDVQELNAEVLTLTP
jgi:ABC-type nitrate/sulfonate/bicarbonate transport system ATPase subunit